MPSRSASPAPRRRTPAAAAFAALFPLLLAAARAAECQAPSAADTIVVGSAVVDAAASDSAFHTAVTPAAVPATAAKSRRAPGAPRTRDFSIALKASTLGAGLEAAKLVGGHAALRVGAQGATYDGTTPDAEGVSSGYNVKLRTIAALVDLFPFRRGAFRLSGGVVSGTTSVGYTETGEIVVGDDGDPDAPPARSYDGTSVESLSYPTTRPYAGFGWGTPASRRGGLGFVADFGVLFGRPEYRTEVTGPAAADPAVRAEIEADRQSVQEDLDKFGFYPKIGFGLSYRF